MSSQTPTTQSRNLAARMGRWSADHWKTATFGWLAFVVVAFGLGGMAGMKSIDPDNLDRESRVAWTGSSTRASTSPRVRASSYRARRSG